MTPRAVDAVPGEVERLTPADAGEQGEFDEIGQRGVPPLVAVATMRRPEVRLDAAALETFRALGRIGGKKGGKARWEGVSAEARRAHARRAAAAR
jgi:hypothetical protein